MHLATRHLVKLSGGKRVKEVCSHCKEQLVGAAAAVAGPSVCFAADLVLGLYVQNYNLWSLNGLGDRLKRLRKLGVELNILRFTMEDMQGQW